MWPRFSSATLIQMGSLVRRVMSRSVASRAALIGVVAWTMWVAVTVSPFPQRGISALLVLSVQFERLVLRIGMISDLAKIAHVDLLTANRAREEMREFARGRAFMSVPD
ncbi:hypothetical protein X768_18545 [Mesorhizobium sp. LSJC265A00]|nr:hypothetical protein X768_18545 [Mesorhizobium sp. LSJC265A00]